MTGRVQYNQSRQIVKGPFAEFMAAATPVIEDRRDPGVHIDRIRPDRIYSFADLSRLTGRAASTLRRWRDTGRLQVLSRNRSAATGLCYIRAEQIRPRPETQP